MKLKKLPGFSLGLIALAVGNAYAGPFIQHEDKEHALKIDSANTENIDNALVITTGNGSYGYPLQERVAS